MAKKTRKGKHTGTSVTLVRTRLAVVQKHDQSIIAMLGPEIGKGGASTIHAFEPPLDTSRIAKIYKDEYRKDPTLDALSKLLALVVRHDELTRRLPFVMWPDELVFDRPNVIGPSMREALLGFTMPCLPAGTISLYTLLKVAKYRPNFQSGATVRLAARLADHLARLHDAGIVFCDMNPKNIHVTKDLDQLYFIDADGFQASLGSRLTPSRGVTEGYASPAAIANHQTNPTALRSPGDDAFVLAIFVFQLLIDRAHPFHTGPLYVEHASASLNDNIVARRFAFAKPAIYRPDTEAFALYARLVPPLKVALHRAFLTATPPSAAEWARLLSSHLSAHIAATPTPEPTAASLIAPPSLQQGAGVKPIAKPRRRPSRRLLIAGAIALPAAMTAGLAINAKAPSPPAELADSAPRPSAPNDSPPGRLRIINMKSSPEVTRMLAELPDTLADVYATVQLRSKTGQ